MGILTGYILMAIGVVGSLTSVIKQQLYKQNKPVVSGITTIQQVKSLDNANDDSEYNNYNRVNLASTD